MKRVAVIVLMLSLAGVFAVVADAQSSQEEKKAADKVLAEVAQTKAANYNPEGRRDPFKNLLAGKDVKAPSVRGVPQLIIDDVNLIGIVKNRGRLTAIVSGPQGFPYFIKVGDKFSDGYVVSITETQIVFRKVSDRGVPLMRPRDIVKELNPQER